MIHKMKLTSGPFEKIKNGQKTIEIRLHDDKRKKVQVGDSIEFTKTSDAKESLTVEVVELLPFDSFLKMLESVSLRECGCDESMTKDDFLNSIYKIYTREDESKYGVLGIRIKIV